MITWLLSNLAGLATALATLLVAAGGIYLKGRSSGKATERQKQEEANADFQANRVKRDAAIDGLSDADLDSRLHDPRLDGKGG